MFSTPPRSGYLQTLLIFGYSLAIFFYSQHPNTGSFFSKNEILRMPEFATGGRVDFSRDLNPQTAFTHLRLAKVLLPLDPAEPWIVLALFLLVLWILGTQRSKYPKFDRIIIFLGCSSLGLFFLARWLLPQLFLPERYLYYGYLPLVYLLIIRGLAIGGQYLGNSPWYKVLALAGLVYSGLWYFPPRDLGVKHYEDHRGLYEAVRAFPETRLLAGPPDISSQIPSFCRQPVLMSDEAAHAIYFKNYYHYVKPRMDDFVEAYTSRDPEVLKTFLLKYQIDYLILDKAFLEKGKMWFYEPYAREINEKMSSTDPAELAISKLPMEYIDKVDWRYWLLDVSAYINGSTN